MANASQRILWTLAVLAWISSCQAQCLCSGVLNGAKVNIITFEYEERRTMALVPGHQYGITCSDNGVTPVWSYNGTSVSNDASANVYQTSNRFGSRILNFESFSIDQAGEYSCNRPCPSCIINFIPGNPTMYLSTQSVTRKINSGQSILVFYVFSGNPYPPFEGVSWSHNGAPLTFPNSLGASSSFNALTINPKFTNNHEGNYTATITSTAGSGSDTFYLTLQHFPVANLSVKSTEGSRWNKSDNSYMIPIHSSVTIRCYDSLGTDGPLEFTWRKDNLLLTGYSHTIQTSQNASTLMFEIVDLTYAGNYECSIENSVGINITKAQIIVAYAPVISKASPEQISWISGNEGEIQVLFEGAVPEPRAIWTRQLTNSSQQETLLVNESDFTFSGLHSLNLTLTDVTPADAGIYSVTAFNYVGNATQRFRVDVLVPPRLVPVSKTSLVAPAGSEVTIDLAILDAVPPVIAANLVWIPSGGVETFNGSHATVTYGDISPGNLSQVTALVFHPAQCVNFYIFQVEVHRAV